MRQENEEKSGVRDVDRAETVEKRKNENKKKEAGKEEKPIWTPVSRKVLCTRKTKQLNKKDIDE